MPNHEVRSVRDCASDDAVEAATGHRMSHWTNVLDQFDVHKQGHKAAAKHLELEHGVDAWWSQNLTIAYEQEKGIRKPGQRSDGSFEVNVSKTIQADRDELFSAFASAASMDEWFSTGTNMDFQVGGTFENNDNDKGTYTKIVPPGTPNQRGEYAKIVFTWENAEHCPGTKVSVLFVEAGPGKNRVQITHMRLASTEDCASMKEGWSWALASLKSWLETGQNVSFESWKSAQS